MKPSSNAITLTAVKIERVSQKAVGARQALAEHEFRVGEVLALEQLVQIALGHRIACRDLRDAEFGIVKIGKHVGLDRCQPDRADGRSFGKLLACALASKRHSDQIVQVTGDDALRDGVRQDVVIDYNSEILPI